MMRKIWLRKAYRTEKEKGWLSSSLKVPNSGPRTSAVVLITPVRAIAVTVASPAGQDAVSIFTLKGPGITPPPCRIDYFYIFLKPF